MSTAVEKRTLREAISEARGFRDLFDGCYQRWVVAGSVRRQRPLVGDVEHVVIPRWDEGPSDLFGDAPKINLLLMRRDKLIEARVLARHVYSIDPRGAPIHRQGNKYFGCDFNGFNHEIFTANAGNWGSQLVIRTGPAEFSRDMMGRLLKRGLRHVDGAVFQCEECRCAQFGHTSPIPACRACQGTGLAPRQKLATPVEEFFFQLAGAQWVEPENRQ